jgi:hypothetical protein
MLRVNAMNARPFERLTQQTTRGASRRIALIGLGAAGLASAFAGVDVEPAKAKRDKNACKKQTDQCITVFTPGCGEDADCLATVQTCCPIIGRCEFNGFFDCVEATSLAERMLRNGIGRPPQ